MRIARPFPNYLGWIAAVLASTTVGFGAAPDGFAPRLAAIRLSSEQVHPGGTVNLSCEWVNLGTASADEEYTVMVHVRPAAAGDPDVAPATGGDYRPATPTYAWLPGAVIEERDRPIRIPHDFPPGQYRVLIGMYSQDSGQRVPLANEDLATAGTRYRIATLHVVPRDKPAADRPVSQQWHDTRALSRGGVAAGSPTEKAITLDSGKLRVALSEERPVVLKYELPDGTSLGGDSSGYPLRVRWCRVADSRYRTVCLRDPAAFRIQRRPAEATYAVQVDDNGQPAVRFEIVFRLEANVLRVGVEVVREQPGYLLMDVFLPQLVSARGPAGALALPTQSGRLVHLNRSAPGCHTIGMNWFEADLCGAVIGDGLAAAIRSRDWDNELDVRVVGSPGKLAGGYAARLALRAEASAKAAKVRLAETPAVEVAVLGGAQPGVLPDWIDAAKWLRQEVHGSPVGLYQDTFIYKIFCDSPGAKDFTTFEDALGVIRRVHQLAPWLKQVVYLVGWQYQGHDTGYPATDQVNRRLGGLDGLRRLAAEAAKCNAILSYHDNFDDAYRDSPQWDETVVARGGDGELQKGGVWAGGQSYILAFNKYAKKSGLERVRRTVGQMPVRGSYHIDVLSAVPMRRDYHLAQPESTRDSLEGKFAIVRQFNRLDIDVTSEGFTAPFVGVIGHAWHLWRNDEPLLAGEEPIPFIPMIYHGGPTTYGRGNPNAAYTRDNALYGATYSTDWTKHTGPHDMAEPLYLVVAPWTCLRDRKMQGYQRQGDLCRVTYAADTWVEVNRASGQWRVVADGVTVVENDLAVVRKGTMVAVYAGTSRRATIDLPESLRGKRLAVTNACTGAAVTSVSQATPAAIVVDLPAREPVLIRAYAE